MADTLYHGRRFRTLNVLDEGVREALTLVIDTSIPGARVVRTLDRLVQWLSKPETILVEIDPENVSEVVAGWCRDQGIRLIYMQPGKPNQIAHIQRFNRTLLISLSLGFLFIRASFHSDPRVCHNAEMDMLTLESTFKPHLRGQFSNGSVVLFLGGGFSLNARNHAGESIPSSSQLARTLWQLCFPRETFDETTRLQDIFETALRQRRKPLTALMQRTFSVDPDLCPEWYQRLLMMPWLRIYTLNIDNLVQQLLSTQKTSRPIRLVSAMSSAEPVFQDSTLSVVHLNGTLEDLPDNVAFARTQYAQREALDRAYIQLRNDLLFRSVIFVGTSMEEGPLWEHLEMRGPRGHRGQKEIRPRSYLVVPNLNRSKESLLSRHNVQWLPMNAREFCEAVLDDMEDESRYGHRALARLTNAGGGSPEQFSRVTDLASNDEGTEEYLLGAEPTWTDVTAGRVATRDCFDDFWDVINEIRAGTRGRRFLVVTGTAGTGKSSAIMLAAMRLEADGVPVAWMDSTSYFTGYAFRRALSKESTLGALFINDSDIYDGRLSSMVIDALDRNPRLLLVCEMRSSKVDRVLRSHELNDIEQIEYTIPSLGDNDIDAILDVLDREHRLGRLKGLDRAERRRIFQGQAGRQLLVAMHFATHGKDFGEKAKDELKEMTANQQALYGLICVASAHRFALRQDDVGIAFGDQGTSWLQTLNGLVRRKLIIPSGRDMFRSRHRMIAQFAYDSLVQEGRLHHIVSALIRIGATKTTQNTRNNSVHARLLRTFINHNLMRRGIGPVQAREIYSDFEDALEWNYHYWLHRGALELETDNLDLAENFLNQAKGINERDVFVHNELAYLDFKKAIENPTDENSPALVSDAIETLNNVVRERPDQIAHAYHIMGQQGLLWVQRGITDPHEKTEFLEYLERKVGRAADLARTEIMSTLHGKIRHALLSLAVQNERSGR